jgi:hypothetical protein
MSANMARILMYHNFSGPGEPNNDWYTSIEHEDRLNTFGSVVSLSSLAARLASSTPFEKNTVALTV